MVVSSFIYILIFKIATKLSCELEQSLRVMSHINCSSIVVAGITELTEAPSLREDFHTSFEGRRLKLRCLFGVIFSVFGS